MTLERRLSKRTARVAVIGLGYGGLPQAGAMRRGQLIILESTTYPGTTVEIIKPALEAMGLTAGRDFFLAFSPERIDPGNRRFTIRNTPKIVGGFTPRCTRLAVAFYRQF